MLCFYYVECILITFLIFQTRLTSPIRPVDITSRRIKTVRKKLSNLVDGFYEFVRNGPTMAGLNPLSRIPHKACLHETKALMGAIGFTAHGRINDVGVFKDVTRDDMTSLSQYSNHYAGPGPRYGASIHIP